MAFSRLATERACRTMRYTSDQYMQMSKRLDECAWKNADPEKAKKQAATANVFRLLAAKAAKQGAESAWRRRPATSQPQDPAVIKMVGIRVLRSAEDAA